MNGLFFDFFKWNFFLDENILYIHFIIFISTLIKNVIKSLMFIKMIIIKYKKRGKVSEYHLAMSRLPSGLKRI